MSRNCRCGKELRDNQENSHLCLPKENTFVKLPTEPEAILTRDADGFLWLTWPDNVKVVRVSESFLRELLDERNTYRDQLLNIKSSVERFTKVLGE